MKKILLTGVALVAMAAAPAQAEGLKLDLAGHAKAYAAFTNEDENANVDMRGFDVRKETEIHFTGETTLDSGLTVGAHLELDMDIADNNLNESYVYFSGGWGRINFGEEDGAAYLLQVSAPSADANIDGLRQYINTFNYDGVADVNGAVQSNRLDYDMVAPVAGLNNAAKLSYMTPVFNGFQAGVSYIPSLSEGQDSLEGNGADDNGAQYDDAWELAARYEGAFEGVGVAFGAGYGKYNAEDSNVANTVSDDATSWNVGLDLDFADIGFGAAYLDQSTEALGAETETNTWVVGADYTMGAYKFGISYLDQDVDAGIAANDVEIDRWTAGVSYAYGPGMSFRGAVSMFDRDIPAANGDTDGTQVTLGTQINF